MPVAGGGGGGGDRQHSVSTCVIMGVMVCAGAVHSALKVEWLRLEGPEASAFPQLVPVCGQRLRYGCD